MRTNKVFTCLVLSTVLSCCLAEWNIPTLQELKMELFMGRWHVVQVSKRGDTWFDEHSCITFDYANTTKGIQLTRTGMGAKELHAQTRLLTPDVSPGKFIERDPLHCPKDRYAYVTAVGVGEDTWWDWTNRWWRPVKPKPYEWAVVLDPSFPAVYVLSRGHRLSDAQSGDLQEHFNLLIEDLIESDFDPALVSLNLYHVKQGPKCTYSPAPGTTAKPTPSPKPSPKPSSPPTSAPTAAPKPPPPSVQVGVGVFVIREDKVLVGRRINGHDWGHYSIPFGPLDFLETPIETALREVREETALNVTGTPKLGPYTNDRLPSEQRHLLSLSVVVESPPEDGEPLVAGPDSNQLWRWVTWEEFRALEPMSVPTTHLLAIGFDPVAFYSDEQLPPMAYNGDSEDADAEPSDDLKAHRGGLRGRLELQ